MREPHGGHPDSPCILRDPVERKRACVVHPDHDLAGDARTSGEVVEIRLAEDIEALFFGIWGVVGDIRDTVLC